MLLYFFYTFIYVDNFNAFMPIRGPLLNFSHKEVSKSGESCPSRTLMLGHVLGVSKHCGSFTCGSQETIQGFLKPAEHWIKAE